jgi:hypothetical protein
LTPAAPLAILPAAVRAALSAFLALVLVVASAAPHVHAQAQTSSGGDECTLCTVRHAAPTSSALPDVAPVVYVEGDAAASPGLPPVLGAPLGAVPGQSPPALA